jgi:thiamine biosynthesis lipoprotein
LEGDRVIKDNPAIMLDASAIAKGYACDVVSAFLDSKEIENYMVEIGGEVVVKGRNDKGTPWAIGITKPVDDNTMMRTELQNIVYMESGGVATSGNYRQYYYKNGKKYAHTIDPQTGYPTYNNLLSATVIAPNCMLADAYATAFMVLGLEQSLLLADYMPDIEAYLIYSNSRHSLAEKYTKGFKRYLK